MNDRKRILSIAALIFVACGDVRHQVGEMIKDAGAAMMGDTGVAIAQEPPKSGACVPSFTTIQSTSAAALRGQATVVASVPTAGYSYVVFLGNTATRACPGNVQPNVGLEFKIDDQWGFSGQGGWAELIPVAGPEARVTVALHESATDASCNVPIRVVGVRCS